MIQLEDISYAAGSKMLLDKVSVSFEPGRLNMIIGPNGAGKSTLIRILGSQIKPDSGKVFFDQKELRKYSLPEIARKRALLTQSIELAFPLKVWEVVMMGRYPHFSSKPEAKDEKACEEAMRFFEVWDFADRNYLSLSGGEKQRVNFARVMTQIWEKDENESRYLILDEPLTFLDVHYQHQFIQQLLSLLNDQNFVVAAVVHDLNLAARFAGHILLLHQGRVLASGSKDVVLSKENLRQAYQIEPTVVKQDGGFYLFF